MPSADTTLTPGKQITKGVVLVSPLSSGGMGAVWLADHQGLKTRVVVKFMLDDLNASSSARTRFSREAAAAANVKSPHVVQMLDHGLTEDGVPFIVMEHLEGHDLGDELEAKGALEPAKAVAIVTQVAKALAKVHAAGLLHRDIKPDNIFLVDGEEDVFVKLLDFGIAKTAPQDGVEASTSDSDTKTGQIVGTPFYMSPEQVTASKALDLRSDLWALGIVAYEALTGKRPYDGPSFGALAVKIATGAVLKPTEVNPALPMAVDAWFAKACARETADRFGSAKELADALRAAFDGVVSLSPPISGDSGARSTPRQANATTLGLAKTAEANAATQTGRSDPLARSEAGVSVSAAKTQRSSLVLLGGLVAVAVVGIALNFMRKAPEPTTVTPPPQPTTEPVPATVVPPAPKVTAAPAVSSVAVVIDAGAPPVMPATTHAKPTATTKPVEPPTAKPSATPKPSAEPDPLY